MSKPVSFASSPLSRIPPALMKFLSVPSSAAPPSPPTCAFFLFFTREPPPLLRHPAKPLVLKLVELRKSSSLLLL
ncbi:hypothetical protein HAX54_027743 [Datura stramonium]|uniref:Uncharacterized protein n=1 Tax=Datura stramonium TaxID=4076 RepID=A0ABS8V5S5_DATST|nr:hypothetical protein [Datura stramonium]